MKLQRFAMLALPAFGGVVTAAVLAGPGRERPVVGARVSAALTVGASTLALRVRTVAHYRGLYRAAAAVPLRLEVSEHGFAQASWHGQSSDDGLVDLVLPLRQAAEGELQLTLWRDDQLAGHGRVAAQAKPRLAQRPSPNWGRGPVAVWATLPRSVLVPEIEERLRVEVRVPATLDATTPRPDDTGERGGPGPHAPPPPTPLGAPQLSWQAPGADLRRLGGLGPPDCDASACMHHFALGVTARAPSVQLELTARAAGGAVGRWRGELPLAAGGAWLDPSSAGARELRLRTAMPRDRIFATVAGPGGRLWSTIIALHPDEQGGATGHAALPALPTGPLMALLSTDADEGPAATVAWPLRPDLGRLSIASLARVADGLPAVIAAEARRRAKARRPAYGLVIAIGVLELLLLWRLRVATGLELRERLTAGEGEPVGGDLDPQRVAAIAGRAPLWWLTLIVGVVALAFAVLAAVAAWA